jgi:hypothetical protein
VWNKQDEKSPHAVCDNPDRRDIVLYFGNRRTLDGTTFFTDDPETPEYRHGEFYIASQYAKDDEGKSATLPHFEFNYAVLPDVMLHTIVPLAWNKPNDESSNYGLGDVEFGVKYRSIHESDTIPQVGTLPI